MEARAMAIPELDDPVARELLNAPIPARLAYLWFDGTPRVVPIWFQWTGEEIVMVGSPDAPKVQPIRERPDVAITIDANDWPYHVLMVRGKASIQVQDGLALEYQQAAVRYLGKEGGDAWLAQAEQLFPQTARIAVRPEWAWILDFETRFPQVVARAMAG
jgi:hypothetical protein